jgi:hypothetical protein
MGFVKSYIQMFAYGSATTEEWKAYLFTYFQDKVTFDLSLPPTRGLFRLRPDPISTPPPFPLPLPLVLKG